MISLIGPRYAGRFRLRKFRGSVQTFDSGWFSNLVLDNGLDQVANVPLVSGIPYLITQGYVGTGTSDPLPNQVSLENYLASSDTLTTEGTNAYIAGPPVYWRHIRTFTFAVGTITGILSEVGVGKTKDTLFSRALIVDQFGSIAPVTVLEDEGIQLSYELRSYVNPGDAMSTVIVQGNTPGAETTHQVTVRPAQINTAKTINIGMGYTHNNIALYSGEIQANTLVPLGSHTSLTTYAALDAYTPGSFQASFIFNTSFAEATANYAEGVKAVRVTNSQCDFQMGFDPPIMKTSRDILRFGVTLTWGRYSP